VVCFIVMVMSYCSLLFSNYYAHVLGSLYIGGAFFLVCVHLHQAFVVCCTHLGGAHPSHIDLFPLTLVWSSPKRGRLKEHFLAKSIFGCLLSILRYLTLLSQFCLSLGEDLKLAKLMPCLSRRLWVSRPETLVCTHRRLWLWDRRL
jgi:hypothetical protein